MNSIKDNIKMVADSMNAELSEENITQISHEILGNRDYIKMII